jgi:hypothetical protein
MSIDNKNVTKKQHYVPRYYLASWTSNKSVVGTLWVKHIKDNKMYKNNLTNIVQENYFYDV